MRQRGLTRAPNCLEPSTVGPPPNQVCHSALCVRARRGGPCRVSPPGVGGRQHHRRVHAHAPPAGGVPSLSFGAGRFVVSQAVPLPARPPAVPLRPLPTPGKRLARELVHGRGVERCRRCGSALRRRGLRARGGRHKKIIHCMALLQCSASCAAAAHSLRLCLNYAAAILAVVCSLRGRARRRQLGVQHALLARSVFMIALGHMSHARQSQCADIR